VLEAYSALSILGTEVRGALRHIGINGDEGLSLDLKKFSNADNALLGYTFQ